MPRQSIRLVARLVRLLTELKSGWASEDSCGVASLTPDCVLTMSINTENYVTNPCAHLSL